MPTGMIGGDNMFYVLYGSRIMVIRFNQSGKRVYTDRMIYSCMNIAGGEVVTSRKGVWLIQRPDPTIASATLWP